MKKKIVFFVSTDRYFITHRLRLATKALENGHQVYLITSKTYDKYIELIIDKNIKVIQLNLHRSRLNIFLELVIFLKLLIKIFKIKPDIIHNVALKPVVYGSLVSILLRTKLTINAIAGTGIIFSKANKSNLFLQKLIKFILSKTLKKSLVIVQNNHDKEFIIKLGVHKKSIIKQNGVGVNLNEYKKRLKLNERPKILLASRLLWSKGVGDYVDAIKILNKKGKSLEFLLAGFSDTENPDHIKDEFIKNWQNQKLLTFLGWVEDMPELLTNIDIFCLPSYYGEGIPKSLIEATASGIPCITTDTPGCRSAVKNNENGFLVGISNPKEIASSIEKLTENKKLYLDMSEKSRRLAERNFDEEAIINQTLNLYEK